MSCENCPFLEDCRGRRADLLREKEGFERRLRGLEEPALGTDPDLEKIFLK